MFVWAERVVDTSVRVLRRLLSCKAIHTFGILWCPSNNSALAKKIKSQISNMELCFYILAVFHDFSALKRHCGESLELHGVSKWPL